MNVNDDDDDDVKIQSGIKKVLKYTPFYSVDEYFMH